MKARERLLKVAALLGVRVSVIDAEVRRAAERWRRRVGRARRKG
jgi:hypothetical protein